MIGEFIGEIIIKVVGTIVWNIWKEIGISVRWSWFRGKKSIEEIRDHPDNALVGFLTLLIVGITSLIIWASTV